MQPTRNNLAAMVPALALMLAVLTVNVIASEAPAQSPPTPTPGEPANPCQEMGDADPDQLAAWLAERNGITLDRARAVVDDAIAGACDHRNV